MKVNVLPVRLPSFIWAWISIMLTLTLIGGHEGTEQKANTLTRDHPWIGEQAPDFSLKSTKGQSVSLSDFKGEKSVVIHFGASW